MKKRIMVELYSIEELVTMINSGKFYLVGKFLNKYNEGRVKWRPPAKYDGPVIRKNYNIRRRRDRWHLR